jgi:hypothetical protein
MSVTGKAEIIARDGGAKLSTDWPMERFLLKDVICIS